jgi:hypothetical protein
MNRILKNKIYFLFVICLIGLAGFLTYRYLNFKKTNKPVYSISEDRWKKALLSLNNFKLIDQYSNAHSFINYKHLNKIVIISLSSNCLGAEDKYLEKLKSLKIKDFIFLSNEEVAFYSKFAGFKTPVLHDRWNMLTRKLNLTRANQ